MLKHINILIFFMKLYPLYIKKKFKNKKKYQTNKQLIKLNYNLIQKCKRSLYQMAIFDPKFETYIESYKKQKIISVKIHITDDYLSPILLCVVKNDLIRVIEQVKYHKKIGINNFVYIDNMSTDGTLEWLKMQEDISLFTIDEKFDSRAKNSWRRQAMDILGYDRWYLLLDSDEFFIYPGIESKKMNEYINFLEKKHIKCAFTPIIDMYSKKNLFYGNINDFTKDYCYFDINTYESFKCISSIEIRGGPRKRLFYKNGKKGPLLSKYSLIKAKSSYVVGTHLNYPCWLNYLNKNAIGFLLHYKFLQSDDEKYKENMLAKTFSSNSIEYRTYYETYNNNPNISFYCNKSEKLNSSLDLLKVNLADLNFFNKFLRF